MHIHIIQHETFEAPGAYLDWAIQNNHSVSFSKVYEYQPLPETIDNIDFLLIMGGPQSPNTTKEECPYFDGNAEKAIIKKCIDADKIVVGVCLGAQLIGEALGSKTEQSPEKEIGVFDIELTDDGMVDENINHFGKTLPVGHWHNDMPGLTEQSKILAISKGCPRQIIAYSDKVYGFQCHMEFTPNVVEGLIAEEIDFLENNTTHQYVQKPNEIRAFDYTTMNNKLFSFLDKLTR